METKPVAPKFSGSNVVKKAMPQSLGSISVGDLVICHCSPTIEPVSVSLSLAHAAFSGTSWGAIHFKQPTPLRTVFSTPLPSAAVLHAMVANAPANTLAQCQSLCGDGIAEVPLLDELGLAQLRRMVLSKYKHPSPELPKLLTISVRIPADETSKHRFGLVHLSEAISRIGAATILVVQGSDPTLLSAAVPRGDILFIDACEPDPDAVLAFTIRPKAFGDLWLADPDPYMVSLLKAPAESRWRHELFLAHDPISRFILRQKKEGASLEDIGKGLDLDKSTIKRRLDKLKGL